jgi:hypothetical protein
MAMESFESHETMAISGPKISCGWCEYPDSMGQTRKGCEKVAAENGVRRGLGKWHVTLRMCGLDWYGILRRRLVKVWGLFGFDKTQLFLQFSDFGFLPLDFFSCIGFLLHCKEPLFSLASSSASFRNLASSASYVALAVAAAASWFGLAWLMFASGAPHLEWVDSTGSTPPQGTTKPPCLNWWWSCSSL